MSEKSETLNHKPEEKNTSGTSKEYNKNEIMRIAQELAKKIKFEEIVKEVKTKRQIAASRQELKQRLKGKYTGRPRQEYYPCTCGAGEESEQHKRGCKKSRVVWDRENRKKRYRFEKEYPEQHAEKMFKKNPPVKGELICIASGEYAGFRGEFVESKEDDFGRIVVCVDVQGHIIELKPYDITRLNS